MKTKKVPEVGVAYTYSDVANFYDHDKNPVHYVVVKGHRILALRLREDYNYDIFAVPAQVWVGEKPEAVKAWGNILAYDTVCVDVFVKKRDKRYYTFVGAYEVLTREATQAELANASEKVPHKRGVSRIVFLKKL
jgi:hypothetical protein